ncbi:Roadblock/LC7 domain-containing protein [Desulfonema limicola]|uniref:Roadblock/LC7 domain-containing protein n=2 Tax=Desulfonema limicola TaxID=45656 RepID=A0A975GIM5_9BACT|nr:Roadblock/LC7 domain-containing protein [Desulfonema limicola]
MGAMYDVDIVIDDSYTLEPEQLEQIEQVLDKELIREGMQSILLIDMYGNIISKYDDQRHDRDLYALAALSSANYAAVTTMAKLVGEEDFPSLFHKGQDVSVFFRKITEDFLIVVIFGEKFPLGALRMQLEIAVDMIIKIFQKNE